MMEEDKSGADSNEKRPSPINEIRCPILKSGNKCDQKGTHINVEDCFVFMFVLLKVRRAPPET
jgi:hypothetical protein